MNVQTKQTNLAEKLDSFLMRACQAEAAGDKEEAERFFALALRYEELSQSKLREISNGTQKVLSENGNKQS